MLGVRRRGFSGTAQPSTGSISANGRTGSVIDISGSSGTAADNAIISVTGPAATLPTLREWLGGATGVIESATNGAAFSRANWSPLGAGSTWYYTQARPNNRIQCLVFDSTINLHYAGTQFYDHGAAGFTDLYTSCNYYCETPAAVSNFQWKIKRWMPNLSYEGDPEPDVRDGINPSAYISRYKIWTESFINVFNEDPTVTRWYSTGQTWPMNAWFRLETWMSRNAVIGAATGYYRIKCTRLSDGVVTCDQSYTNVLWRGASATVPHRYDTYQNYCGNAADSGYPRDWGDAKIYMEDILSQAHASATDGSSQVRAELCNNAVYNSATKRIPCYTESIVGTTWNVRLNGPANYFGSNLSGMYLALFPASGTPTMVQI